MPNMYAWIDQELADSTWYTLRHDNTELVLHTGKKTRHVTGTPERLKVSGHLRIKRDRGHGAGMVNLHLTLHLSGGRDDMERWLSREMTASMFGVPGYDLGRNTLTVRDNPGATHAIEKLFVRNAEYVKFLGASFKLLSDLPVMFERFMETGRFR